MKRDQINAIMNALKEFKVATAEILMDDKYSARIRFEMIKGLADASHNFAIMLLDAEDEFGDLYFKSALRTEKSIRGCLPLLKCEDFQESEEQG